MTTCWDVVDVLISACFHLWPCWSQGRNPIRPCYFNTVRRWAAHTNWLSAPDVRRGRRAICFVYIDQSAPAATARWGSMFGSCIAAWSHGAHRCEQKCKWAEISESFIKIKAASESLTFRDNCSQMGSLCHYYSICFIFHVQREVTFQSFMVLFLHRNACCIRLFHFFHQAIVITFVAHSIMFIPSQFSR